jgi:DNA-binding response OmpR family regulator
MPFKILVADDNINDKKDEISRLPEMLHTAGYEVVSTPDGEAVYDLFLDSKPDLIVLDIWFGNEPEMGFEICKSIRDNDKRIPIILITVPRASTDDILRGFDAGANDYVTRPRDNREIIARIQVNLPPGILLVDNYLCVDLVGSQVYTRQGGSWQEVPLQRLVFELLKVLIVNAGLVMLTTVLKSKIWEDIDKSDDALAALILRLRKGIEPDPVHPVYIENIKGFGYRFNGGPTQISRRAFEKLIE